MFTLGLTACTGLLAVGATTAESANTQGVDPRLSALEDPQGIMKILPRDNVAGARDALQETLAGQDANGLDWEKIEKLMKESSHLHYRNSSENRFLVYSESSNAMAWVATVAGEVLRVANRFGFHAEVRGQRILVEVVLVEEGLPPPFQTTILPGGEVRLVVPWNSQVQRVQILQGLFQALLVSEVFSEFGLEAATRVKPWAELALTIALEVQMASTMLDEYQEQAVRLPWMPLQHLFSIQQPLAVPTVVAENGFWFLRWMERHPARPEWKRRLMMALSCTTHPASLLEQAFPREWRADPGLDFWWATRFQEITAFQNSPYWNMTKSRETLRRLAVLQFPYDRDIQVAMLKDWSGWVLYQPAQKAIESQILELQVALEFVHPIYYNAYLSLGLLMDFCRNEFKSEADLNKWQALLSQVEQDLREAFRLEQQIQSKLSDL